VESQAEKLLNALQSSKPSRTPSIYERRINLARILAAFAFGKCGVLLLVAMYLVRWYETTGLDPAAWNGLATAAVFGMLVSMAVTVLLVVEATVRYCVEACRSRRWQFSLITLLVVTTVIALLCGIIASIAA
jgi:hypothetical protein